MLKHLEGETLFIDVYNVTITLENAIKGHLLIKGNDGFIRDLSGTFRGFRQSDNTRYAWSLILNLLGRYQPGLVVALLDKPYSKSRQLASSIEQWMLEHSVRGRALLSKRVDYKLKRAKGIRATSDSSILLKGSPSLDLAGHIATRRLRRTPLVVP